MSVDATNDPIASGAEAAGARRARFEERLRALRTDERNVAVPGLLATYSAIAVLVPAVALADAPWLYVAAAFPIGLLQYRITLSGHEAVHKTLCYPLALNEFFGVLGQSLVGVNFASYRVQHLDHHRATGRDADPDGHIYGSIVGAPRGWPRVLTWTLGTFVELAIKIWQKGIGSIGRAHADAATVKTAASSRLHSLFVILAQTSLLFGLAALTGHWWGYLALWIAPLFGVAVFLNRSRIMVEHGLALLAGYPPVARSIPTVDLVPAPWERWIFAPFLFNYHCGHHLYLTVPHYNLPALRELLREFEIEGYHEVEGGYLRAIATAMRA
jgi:fatty acid desaturase